MGIKLLNWFTIIVLCTSFSLCGQTQTLSHVIIKVPWNTKPSDSIFLCSLTCQLLNFESHLTFSGDVDPKIKSFTINRGTDATRAVDVSGKTAVFEVTQTKTVFSVVSWLDQRALSVVGEVVTYKNFYSSQLKNKRSVNVWLPPDYHFSTDRYPVIYVHDGQNVFDPKTSTTGIDWQVDDIMQDGVLNHSIGPAIVVAIDCIKKKRYDEYDYTVKGNLYADFLINDVKPFIDQNFRTLPNRESTYTMGSSMGGLISLALLWKHPEVFSRAAALSLAVHIHNKSIYEVIKSSPKPILPIAFYMDHGGYNDDAKYEADDRPFAHFFLSLGFDPQTFVYDIDPFGDHREIDWARRVSAPLQWLLLK